MPVITQVRFTKIAGEKSFPVMQIVSGELIHVFPHIEKMITDHGILKHRLKFIWNINGTNKHWAVIDGINNSIVAEFEIFNVGQRDYSLYKGDDNANTDNWD